MLWTPRSRSSRSIGECHVGVHLALGLPFGRSFALALDGRAELRLLLRLALLGREIPDGEVHREILVGRSARALHEPLGAFREDFEAHNGVIFRFVPARAGIGVPRTVVE